MIKINRQALEDKVHGCWLGKNIGGTIGTPYEGKRELLDIKGFVTKPGEVLPNDDLDLQLVWLHALEAEGPQKLTSNLLAEYWVSYVPAHWNEYGVGKCNLKAGFLPPLSGEYGNEDWKNSNGAWIRSEIWASLAPGFPNIAAKYAFMDASIDHGLAEGTYGEVFTATLESCAYFESDIRKLIETALTRIPENCEVSQKVRYVIKCYDNRMDCRDVRASLVSGFKNDLDWFQAPCNIAFVIIGLLYGEGDFKKSMLYAINCGDDTDCTGATVGAILGIINGKSGIPEDWASYLGDSIVTVAIDKTSIAASLPKTCTELTSKVMDYIPFMFKAHGIDMQYTCEESDVSDIGAREILSGIEHKLFNRLPYSYDAPYCMFADAIVEFYEKPQIITGESLKVRIRFFNKVYDQRHLSIKLHLPETWTSLPYRHDVHMTKMTYQETDMGHSWEVEITAGERVEAINKAIAEVSSPGRPTTWLIPIIIAG